MNRRLVPMPERKPMQSGGMLPPALPPQRPRARMKTWHTFAFLSVTAVLWYYAGPLILVIAGFVAFVRGLVWLSQRFPKTMFFVFAFCSGLFGWRYYPPRYYYRDDTDRDLIVDDHDSYCNTDDSYDSAADTDSPYSSSGDDTDRS